MSPILDASGEVKKLTEQELKEADENLELITLTHFTGDDGRTFWVYAAIRPSKYHAFIEATKAKVRIEIEDYGTVLQYGYGDEVPAAVKENMKNFYGFDENFEATVKQKLAEEHKVHGKKKEDDRLAGIVAMLKAQQKPT